MLGLLFNTQEDYKSMSMNMEGGAFFNQSKCMVYTIVKTLELP